MKTPTKFFLIALQFLAASNIVIHSSNNGSTASLHITSFQVKLPLSMSKVYRSEPRLQNYYSINRSQRVPIYPSIALSKRTNTEDELLEIARMIPPLKFKDGDNTGLCQSTSQKLVRKSYLVLLASFSSSTTLLSLGLQFVLLQFDWAQDWRYFWPLLGAVYIWDGRRVLSSSHKDLQGFSKTSKSANFSSSSLILPGLKSLWVGWLCVILGAALLLGGASDAFLPVWMTGPNLFTSAGIGQDAAAFLLFLTVISVFRQYTIGNDRQPNFRSEQPNLFGEWNFWTNSFLMAQLYVLGAGTLDEIGMFFHNIIP